MNRAQWDLRPLFVAASLVALALAAPGDADGQSLQSFEPLSIDRPDISNLPTTVRPGHFQFEFGAEGGRGNILTQFHVPNMVFRTGLNRKCELRIGYDNLFLDSVGIKARDQIMLFSIGGKYRFVEEHGARPAIAIQPEIVLPFGSGTDFRYDHADYLLTVYSLVFLFNSTLHEKVFINYNAGVFWSSTDRFDYLLSASVSFLHTHRLGYYLELYTPILSTSVPLAFDGGLMFQISPRLQVDAYFGQRAIGTDRQWFCGSGIGFRLDKGDLKPRRFSEIGIHH